MANITVIIPNFNKADYIAECIQSVKIQTEQDFKCIIVDDGSTDNSSEIIAHEVNNDLRFTVIYQPNHGLSYSRNIGIKEAETEFVLPLDSDDMIEKTYLERAEKLFSEHPEVTLYYGRWLFFGYNADKMNTLYKDLHYSSYANLLKSNSIHCSCIYRKHDAIECGLFDTTMHGYEDWEFLIRLLHGEKLVAWDPRVSLFYRQLPKSRSTDDHAKYLNYVKLIQEKNSKIYQEYQK